MGLTSYLTVLKKTKWQSFNWTTLTEETGVTWAHLTLDDSTTKEASFCQKQPVISFVRLSLQIISRSASMPASRKDNASGKVSSCIKTEEKYAPLKSESWVEQWGNTAPENTYLNLKVYCQESWRGFNSRNLQNKTRHVNFPTAI